MEESDILKQYIINLGGLGNFVEAYLSAMLAVMAIIIAAYVIQSLQKLRQEESAGHLELLLGASVNRHKWIFSHLVISIFGTILLLLLTGITLAVSAGLTAETSFNEWNVGNFVLGSLTYLAPMCFFAGLVIGTMGIMPKISSGISWLAFAFVLFVSQLGAFVKLPEWIMNISPFTHIAPAPSQEIESLPVIIITIVGILAIIIGFIGFRNRDVVAG